MCEPMAPKAGMCTALEPNGAGGPPPSRRPASADCAAAAAAAALAGRPPASPYGARGSGGCCCSCGCWLGGGGPCRCCSSRSSAPPSPPARSSGGTSPITPATQGRSTDAQPAHSWRLKASAALTTRQQSQPRAPGCSGGGAPPGAARMMKRVPSSCISVCTCCGGAPARAETCQRRETARAVLRATRLAAAAACACAAGTPAVAEAHTAEARAAAPCLRVPEAGRTAEAAVARLATAPRAAAGSHTPRQVGRACVAAARASQAAGAAARLRAKARQPRKYGQQRQASHASAVPWLAFSMRISGDGPPARPKPPRFTGAASGGPTSEGGPGCGLPEKPGGGARLCGSMASLSRGTEGGGELAGWARGPACAAT